MDLRILGPFEALHDGEPIAIPGHKARTLLACLIVNSPHAVSRDRLIDAIWADSPPSSAVNTLHTYVTHLRSALDTDGSGRTGSAISTHPNGYRLDLPDDCVDSWRLESALAEARVLMDRREFSATADVLDEALAEWRGPPLEEFLDSDFASAETARLENQKLSLEEMRAMALLNSGRERDAATVLESVVQDYPLNEVLWQQLMIALYRTGRQAESLATFRRLSENLAELGLEPAAETVELESRILERDESLLPRTTEATPAREAVRVPRSTDLFVGREDDLAYLKRTLETNRLVTLTGIGGIGKSRLVAEAIASLGTNDRYVDYAAVDDREAALSRLAETFGASEQISRPIVDRISRAIGTEPTVLVVDNAEDVSEHISGTLDELVSRHENLRVLVTSREPLGVPAEAATSLGPLDANGAIRLFIARSLRPEVLTAAERETVESICDSLNRIPAAIEVVAGASKMLSISEIADNLDVLVAGGEHRNSLPVALEWSYRSLTDGQRSLLEALALFPGGATFEALAYVADPHGHRKTQLSDIGSLIDRSLVIPERGATSRYLMLQVFRGYMLDWQDDEGSAAMIDRFIDFYTTLALDLEDSFGTNTWQTMLDRVDDDEMNLAQAAELALEADDPGRAAAIVGPMGRYWRWRGRTMEGLNLVQTVLAEGDVSLALRAKLERESAGFHRMTGDYEISRVHAATALTLYEECGDDRGRADALYDLGMAAIFSGDFDEAQEILSSSADIWKELREARLAVFPMIPLAWLHYIHGEYDTADAMWTSILTNVDTAMFPEQSGITFRVAELALARGQIAKAKKIATEALEAALAARYPYHEAGARVMLARALIEEGDHQQAAHEGRSALTAAVDSGNVEGAALSLLILGRLCVHAGDIDGALKNMHRLSTTAGRIGGALALASIAELGAQIQTARGQTSSAASLFGFAEKTRSEHRLPLDAIDKANNELAVTKLEAAMPAPEFESTFAAGRGWTDAEMSAHVAGWFAWTDTFTDS